MQNIKVLIIDDSKIMQNLLTDMLSIDSDIIVVGVASDPFEARELIKSTNPDVLTLDIMMPKMDGITFLKNLMRLRPIPVVMISSLVEDNNEMAVESLESGAIDYLPKPSANEIINFNPYALKLVKVIKIAAAANVKNRKTSININPLSSNVILNSDQLSKIIITIGSSTGGIDALERILPTFPKIFPAIVIAQHIKRNFNDVFVNHLNKLCNMTVSEAIDGENFLSGHIYIAPAGTHIEVKRNNTAYFCFLDHGIPINSHKPSVDVLFDSAAVSAGKDAIAVLLTGMGADGARGMKSIKDAGGATIAQDEASSVVWGMPGAAVRMGAADSIVALHEIPQKILNIIDSKINNGVSI